MEGRPRLMLYLAELFDLATETGLTCRRGMILCSLCCDSESCSERIEEPLFEYDENSAGIQQLQIKDPSNDCD